MNAHDQQIYTRAKCWLQDCGYEFVESPAKKLANGPTLLGDAFVVAFKGYTMRWDPVRNIWLSLPYGGDLTIHYGNPTHFAVFMRMINEGRLK